MTEYIEKGRVISVLDAILAHAKDIAGDCKVTNKVCSILENIRNIVIAIPEAYVKPVVKGRWKSVGLGSLECSECGYVDCEKMYHRYCPDCGCFMR